MKILTRKQFLELPANTLFFTYTYHQFGSICIKGDTIGDNDFQVQYFDSMDADSTEDELDIVDNALFTGESFDLDLNCYGRDSCFDDTDTYFAVWEKKDLQQLIGRLTECLNT